MTLKKKKIKKKKESKQSIQLTFWDNSSDSKKIDDLICSQATLKKSLQVLRKGLFKRHDALSKELKELANEIKEIKMMLDIGEERTFFPLLSEKKAV